MNLHFGLNFLLYLIVYWSWCFSFLYYVNPILSPLPKVSELYFAEYYFQWKVGDIDNLLPNYLFWTYFLWKKTCSRLDQWLSKTVVCPQWSRYGPTSISHLLAISLKNTATQQMFKKNIYFATPLYICVV